MLYILDKRNEKSKRLEDWREKGELSIEMDNLFVQYVVTMHYWNVLQTH